MISAGAKTQATGDPVCSPDLEMISWPKCSTAEYGAINKPRAQVETLEDIKRVHSTLGGV